MLHVVSSVELWPEFGEVVVDFFGEKDGRLDVVVPNEAPKFVARRRQRMLSHDEFVAVPMTREKRSVDILALKREGEMIRGGGRGWEKEREL